MTSESIRMEFHYPTGHRDRHTPHLCAECGYPLTSGGGCTRCATTDAPPVRERPLHRYPDRLVRLERMEQAASLL